MGERRDGSDPPRFGTGGGGEIDSPFLLPSPSLLRYAVAREEALWSSEPSASYGLQAELRGDASCSAKLHVACAAHSSLKETVIEKKIYI